MIKEPGISIVKVLKIITETPDVKTFTVNGKDGKKPFIHAPGQCAMVGLPPAGEGMFSISSDPLENYLQFSIKKCGSLTNELHNIEEDRELTVRGPLGRGFPVDTDFKNQNLLFIAGGIGLAPLRSVINYCFKKRENYKDIDIIYGSKTKEDFVFYNELKDVWSKENNARVYLTTDRKEDGWSGHSGFVPDYIKELSLDKNRKAIICGPPIMIKLSALALESLGFKYSDIYTTLEMRMKCGIGKCGRCNIGNKYVCKDGPVFRLDEFSDR